MGYDERFDSQYECFMVTLPQIEITKELWEARHSTIMVGLRILHEFVDLRMCVCKCTVAHARLHDDLQFSEFTYRLWAFDSYVTLIVKNTIRCTAEKRLHGLPTDTRRNHQSFRTMSEHLCVNNVASNKMTFAGCRAVDDY